MNEKTLPKLCIGDRRFLCCFSLSVSFGIAATTSPFRRHPYCRLNNNLALGDTVVG